MLILLLQKRLEICLKGELNFHGTYAHSRSYPDAPTPSLCLADLGTIGLPLSDREAKLVIGHCAQAPFGKGERTVVDKSVRDTWEIEGKLVSIAL